jgi:beta-glucosidase
VVVSDWNAVGEMIVHDFARDSKDAAAKAMQAGVDVDMMSYAYINHLEDLVAEGVIRERDIDEAVKNLLRMKLRLGLIDNPPFSPPNESPILSKEHLDLAREMAVESIVLLKNDNNILPLKKTTESIAIIGPMADAPHDQMGTWVFDGRKEDTQTPLDAFREILGEEVTINYVPGLNFSRDMDNSQFRRARRAVAKSDVALVFLGEESILSGEAHSLADIRLQGAQRELLDELTQTKTPVVLVVMAGRALTLEHEINISDAVLYAWHPGTMGGPAIVDLIMGKRSPSAKLPITFPRHVGQIPIYYNHNLTGRPAPENPTLIEDIPREAGQSSPGNTSYYLDYGTQPLFPFGFGLSYTTFAYDNIRVITPEISKTDSLVVRIDISNTGDVTASEIAQLYITNKAGSIVRPVKELKAFRKAEIKPGETKTIEFILTPNDFAYTGLDYSREISSGIYEIILGPNSVEGLKSTFRIID